SDPAMLSVAADTGVPIVLMHWRGYLDRADASFHYDDVVAEVIAELRTRIDAAVAAGVDPADIIVDPGLGFSKNAEHNWQILAGLSEFPVFDQRLLVAASRKRFIASLVSPEDPAQAGEAEKDEPTAGISACAAQAGAW
ncbi:dihydropteroate synthase, partial [Burkholderia multivorans]